MQIADHQTINKQKFIYVTVQATKEKEEEKK